MSNSDGNPQQTLQQFKEQTAGMSLEQLRRMAGDVLAMARPAETEPQQLRRQRRDEMVLYDIRVDLDRADRPIWRELRIRSDTALDTVHQVLQEAFGWWDYHLYRFALGGHPFDRRSELFLCPFDIHEGEDDGTSAASVRLDETLQDPGDRLRYLYDYGDSWELTLRLQRVRSATGTDPIALCTGGDRAAPPEDCGGLTSAAELAGVLDDPAYFDLEQLNRGLRGPYFVLRESGVGARTLGVLGRLQTTEAGRDLTERLVAVAERTALTPTTDEVAASLGAHLWFLDRIGDGGLELTSAGYLKPVDVIAAAEVVPTTHAWIGKKNREIDTLPVLEFRGLLRSLGLVRKYKGKLMLTRAGRSLRHDPERLLQHLADRLLTAEPGTFAEEAGRLFLCYAAASPDASVPRGVLAEALTELGWRRESTGRVQSVDLIRIGPDEVLADVTDRPVGHVDCGRISPVAAALAWRALTR